ncbi:fibronectin type III domain-containing protein [Amycolatopsis suaedae]|uniref:Fibronectin type III domain-containing protein n=1 Tax=Amycolatopsis suaedae TaxID=2510978 RepID=A0A4Q7IZE8_9PSEU|nr:fibronectin type III domain-containing protein [Amycolatopsis suaedae]RZQ59463.1 fibronectin type III domain-containing protein [Amycolatopsis suaedae]
MRLSVAAAAIVFAAAGCAADTPEAGVRLTATLTSPTHAELHWEGLEPGAAGRVVEFATEENGQYTVLQYAPPQQTAFTHPDLIPETPFFYRLRPYFGPASAEVEVTLPPGEMAPGSEQADHGWAEPKALPGTSVAPVAIRDERTRAGGAATDLKAAVKHANGIHFTWVDHAADEEGYLVEIRPRGKPEFSVAAVLDANITSFGLITLPDEKVATFRVRPYVYGAQSNVAQVRTGT